MKCLYKVFLIAIFLVFSMNAYAGDYKYSFVDGGNTVTTSPGQGDGTVALKMMIKINTDNTLFSVIEKENGAVFNDGSVSLFTNDHQLIQVNRLANVELGMNEDDVPIWTQRRLDDILDGWTPYNNSERYDSIDIYGVYDLGNDISWVGPVTVVREKLPEDAYVRVLITPTEITSQAKWRVVGSTLWKSSGDSVAINPDTVIEDPEYPFNKPTVEIEFMDIPDWNKPDNSSVTISRGVTITTNSHTYLQGTAALSVTLCPPEIADQVYWQYWVYDLGQWSALYPSGFIAKGLPPNANTPIKFSTLTGWDTPPQESGNVETGKTEFIEVCYCEQTPRPPDDIIATTGKYTDHITVWWEKSIADTSSCAVSYKLYRNTIDDPNTAELIVSSIEGNLYNDYNASHSSQYYYWVKTKGSATGDFSKSCLGYKKLESPTGISAASFPVSCEEDFPDRIRVKYSTVDGATVVEIWRAPEMTDLKKAVRIVGNALFSTYDDLTAIANRPYAYWVVAKNDFSVSDPSPFVWGTKCLSPPRIVLASDGDFSEYVLIDWDIVSDATCYRIIRTPVAVKRNVTRDESFDLCAPPYYDRAAVPGVRYHYQVISVNNFGVKESRPSFSDIGWRTISAPKDPTASKGTKVNQIDIYWTHISDATKGYQVFRSIVDDPANSELIADNVLGNSYPDTTAKRSYFYWIKAVGEHDVSPYSESAYGYPILCNQRMSIYPEIAEYPYQESTGSFNVSFNISNETERNKCVWDVFTGFSWISLKSFQGEGNGAVNYSLGTNSGTTDRSGFITVTSDGSELTHTAKQINIFTLDIESILGQGSVIVNGENYTEPIRFNAGLDVTISYVPANGWSSDSNNPSSITMDNNKTITVQFNPKLTVSSEGNGHVAVSVSDIHLGDNISLNAVPEDGWTFKNWKIDLTGSENPSVIVMNAPVSVIAVFEPLGWKAEISLERLSSTSIASIGVRSVEESSIASVSGEYACNLVMPKLPDWNPELEKDIRLQGLSEYNWVLKVDPIGNNENQSDNAMLRWNPDLFSEYGHYLLIQGYAEDGAILVPNMRTQTELEIQGTDIQYFTVRWSEEAPHPTFRLYGAEEIGISKCKVEIDTADTVFIKDAAPVSPDYTCDMVIIPVPDWLSRLSTQIFIEGENEYNWVIQVNPSGNAGAEIATSLLTWDLSTFNEEGGFWQLIKGYDGNGDVVIYDMSKMNQMAITGGNEKIHYTIRWTRWAYVDLNLKQGWNMISIPVIPNNGTDLSELLPDNTAIYEFSGNSYAKPLMIESNKGYWVKVPEDVTYRIWGEPVGQFAQTLLSGWHLMSSGYGNVTPVGTPEGCIEAIYQYFNGEYQVSESILPGFGFWLKTKESCFVKLESF